MRFLPTQKAVHRLFEIGLIGKSVDGGLEIAGAVLFFFVSPAKLTRWVRVFTQHELSDDPDDIVAGLLSRAMPHFTSHSQWFAALFLFGHGIVKVGLVVALLRKVRWAYPMAIGTFGLFVVYQLYRYSHTRSIWLLALSLLDVFVIVITWFEYKRLRSLYQFFEVASDS